jgi:hypothetical protein
VIFKKQTLKVRMAVYITPIINLLRCGIRISRNILMEKYSQSIILVGLLLLTVAVVVLLYRPQMTMDGDYVSIDLQPSGMSLYTTFAKSTTALGQDMHLENFPRLIGDWKGLDQDTSRFKQALGADVVLMRSYFKSEFSQPVYIMIVHSPQESSFHHPIVCYRAFGYQIMEEGADRLLLEDTSWIGQAEKSELTTMPPKLPARARDELEVGSFSGEIPVKKLVVVKNGDNGEIQERRLALYFFIKDARITNDRIGMIRVSALAPTSGSYYNSLRLISEFMSEVVPLLFETPEKPKMVITSLVESGVGGYLVILLILSVPLALIVYPIIITKRKGRRVPD